MSEEPQNYLCVPILSMYNQSMYNQCDNQCSNKFYHSANKAFEALQGVGWWWFRQKTMCAMSCYPIKDSSLLLFLFYFYKSTGFLMALHKYKLGYSHVSENILVLLQVT